MRPTLGRIIVIRQAETKDLPTLLELDCLYSRERQNHLDPAYRHVDGPMSEHDLRQRIGGHGFTTFVAESEGIIVGFMTATIREVTTPGRGIEKEGRLCDAFVLPSHRRRGVASKLYAASCDWFEKAQCHCEGLTVQTGNPAHSLFERLGFAAFSLNMRKRRDSPQQTDGPVGPSRLTSESDKERDR